MKAGGFWSHLLILREFHLFLVLLRVTPRSPWKKGVSETFGKSPNLFDAEKLYIGLDIGEIQVEQKQPDVPAVGLQRCAASEIIIFIWSTIPGFSLLLAKFCRCGCK